MSPLRIHLADNDHFSRAGIMSALARSEDLVLEKSYATISEAIDGIFVSQPDIVLVEESLPCENLGSTIARITAISPTTRVVILAVTHATATISKAHAAGSSGFITKNTIHEDLPAALRMIASGYSLFAQPSDDTTFPPRFRLIADRESVLDALSERDRQLISLVASGSTNSRIAKIMHISEGSVKLYLARIMEKWKISNRVQLAVIATEVGLITFDDLESA